MLWITSCINVFSSLRSERGKREESGGGGSTGNLTVDDAQTENTTRYNHTRTPYNTLCQNKGLKFRTTDDSGKTLARLCLSAGWELTVTVLHCLGDREEVKGVPVRNQRLPPSHDSCQCRCTTAIYSWNNYNRQKNLNMFNFKMVIKMFYRIYGNINI